MTFNTDKKLLMGGLPIPAVAAITESPNFFAWLIGVAMVLLLLSVREHIKNNKENNLNQWAEIIANRKDTVDVRERVAKIEGELK